MASIVYRRLYYRTIPNRILSIVKANFTNRGTIENSWINMQPTERGTGRDRYRVYTGGLTLREGDRLKQQNSPTPKGGLHYWVNLNILQ